MVLYIFKVLNSFSLAKPISIFIELLSKPFFPDTVVYTEYIFIKYIPDMLQTKDSSK